MRLPSGPPLSNMASSSFSISSSGEELFSSEDVSMDDDILWTDSVSL